MLEPITPGTTEKRVTYLTLRDDETGLTETLTTTFGHPFYLVKNVDGTNRPAPEGHEDLGMPWVGAGELKPGDKVRQADGTTGSVTRVQNTLETRQMYNLDVAVADTFYVGEGQWLVHNCGDLKLFNALTDGDSLSVENTLFLGSKILGGKQIPAGRSGMYMSDAPIGQVNGKDVYGRVRITDDDIQGHGMQPHANFELVTKVVRPDGKVTWQVMDNKHIIFSNKP